MEITYILGIAQAIAAAFMRWTGTAIYFDGSGIPALYNLPPIIRDNPAVLKFSLYFPHITTLAVVVLGFIYSDHPWWLLLFVIISMTWASPPYRSPQINLK